MTLDKNHFLDAAEGWLKLGLPEEAALELSNIPHSLKRHSRFMSLTWQLCYAREHWEDALLVANRWTQRFPDTSDAWYSLAITLEKLPPPHGGIHAAWDVLRSKSDLNPEDGRIAMKLASYALKLNMPRQAQEWMILAKNYLKESNMDHLMAEDQELMNLIDEMPFDKF